MCFDLLKKQVKTIIYLSILLCITINVKSQISIDINLQEDISTTVLRYDKFFNDLIPYREGYKWGYADRNKNIVITPKYSFVELFYKGIAKVNIGGIIGDKFYTVKVGRWGLIDTTGRELLPVKFNNIEELQNDLVKIESNGKYGLYDTRSKKLILDCVYHDFRHFNEGFAAVCIGKKWGFIDTMGKQVIPFIYDGALSFNEGLAGVKTHKKWGFIDTTGKQVIPFKYDFVSFFQEGFAGVAQVGEIKYLDRNFREKKLKFAEKWGFINKAGELVVDFKYNKVYPFYEGLAKVNIGAQVDSDNMYIETEYFKFFDEQGNIVNGRIRRDKNGYLIQGGRFGFINTQGDEVIPIIYNDLSQNGADNQVIPLMFSGPSGYTLEEIKSYTVGFKDSIALVNFGLPFREGNWGFIDHRGNEIIYPDSVSNFQGIIIGKEQNGKWRFIDYKGKEFISAKFDNVGFFKGDLAKVKLKGKWGVIDKTGKELISFKYNDIEYFEKEPIRVKISDKWGCVNKKEEIIIPITYDFLSEFKEGLSQVKSNKKWGFIDTTGKQLIPFKYDYVAAFHEGFARVKINEKWGYINKKGKDITPCQYDQTYDFDEGLAQVELRDKWGIIDTTGKYIIPPVYNYVDNKNLPSGLIKVKNKGKWGIFDKTGKEIRPIEFDYIGEFNDGLAVIVLNDKYGFINEKIEEVIPIKYDRLYEFERGLSVARLGNKWFYIDKAGNEYFEE